MLRKKQAQPRMSKLTVIWMDMSVMRNTVKGEHTNDPKYSWIRTIHTTTRFRTICCVPAESGAMLCGPRRMYVQIIRDETFIGYMTTMGDFYNLHFKEEILNEFVYRM